MINRRLWAPRRQREYYCMTRMRNKESSCQPTVYLVGALKILEVQQELEIKFFAFLKQE